MVKMMAGVIFIQLDFARGYKKCIILVVLSEKLLSKTSRYLEDVLDLPEVHDGSLNCILPEFSKNV